MRKYVERHRGWARIGLFFVLTAILGADTARAAGLTMQIQVGAGVPTVVQDNGPGDTAPATGIINFFGFVGPYQVNVVIGQSKPRIGEPSKATIDLQTSVVGGSSEIFTVKLTDTDFPAPFNAVGGKIDSFVGGTKSSGAVNATFVGFVDPTNTSFGTSGASVCTTGPLSASGSPFAAAVADVPCAVNGPFSMTQVLTATIGPNRSLGFDWEMDFTVPECGTIGDFVWHDLNHNGIQDPGEPGINGVTLLLKQGATTLASTVTGPHMTTNGTTSSRASAPATTPLKWTRPRFPAASPRRSRTWAPTSPITIAMAVRCS